jgi:hypothetical protein
MRRILLSFFLVSNLSCFTYAATLKWDGGGGDGLWFTAANWIGDIVPVAGDNVILDNSIVAGSYIVNLPAGANDVIISSLIITPATPNTITLILPVSNTSPTAFIANGAGDAVVLNSGAIFINSSGASSGTTVSVTTTNFFRINNGGRYIHRSQTGHTNNLVSRLSVVAGTENGIFEFDIPASSTISLTGRTYGTLVLSAAANGGAVTYSGNGGTALNINGDLIINTGVTFSIGLSANMIVHGNYTQASLSTFNLQNSTNNNLVRLQGDISAAGIITESNTGLPVLELNGSFNQNISFTGSITNSVSVRINNAAGVTLTSALVISYNLSLQTGKIKTTTPSLLILNDNATVTGGSVSSFVEGPMKKIGDDNFTFPVGKGSIYAPIGFISTGMATTDAFQAEYFRLNPQTAFGVNYQSPPIHHISYVEYWKLDKVAGNVNIPAKITLAVTENSFAKDLATLYVSRYNSADMQWKSDNADSKIPGPVIAPYVTGTITSPFLSPFGIFTIATSEPELINPLPVTLISFSAVKMNNKQSRIEWHLADYYSTSVKFEIERSANGNVFETISTSEANSSNRAYTFYDFSLPEGKIRYRLKLIDKDGMIAYSNIVSLQQEIKNIEINLYPDPVTDKAIINIYSSSIRTITIEIYDASGKSIRQWQQNLSGGRNLLPLHTKDFTAGIYFLCVRTEYGREVVQFIKQ